IRIMPDQRTPTLEELAQRVTALEQRNAILQTLYRYAHAYDRGQGSEWLDLFTDDGLFETRRQAVPPPALTGRAHLTTYCAGIVKGKRPGRTVKHVVNAPLIQLEGERATVITYFVVVSSDEDHGARVSGHGRYIDTLVKDGGVWKFKARVIDNELHPQQVL